MLHAQRFHGLQAREEQVLRGRCAAPCRTRATAPVRAGNDQQQTTATTPVGKSLSDLLDPEAKFRRYGRDFGRKHELNLDWLEAAPRVRVRTSGTRQLDDLVELAVLNERLAGRLEPWQARQKLDYLRKRRKNWERIFEYVTKEDAAATLEMIEEANRKVEAALSEEARERTAVGDLKDQLHQLHDEVQAAQERLQLTQSRVEENLRRVNELKAEAVALERIRAASPSRATAASAVSTAPATTTIPRPVAKPAPGADSAPSTSYAPDLATGAPRRRTRSAAPRRSRGLESSLEIEDALRNFWYPAEFTKTLTKDKMVPFDLFGEPWVMFRDEHGKPACIRDECAHRACPLSLGKVVEGRVECAYHGWKFDGSGECTHMPSTVHCRNVAVAALPCVEKDGFVWVWPGSGTPPEEIPDFTLPPRGFDVHAEIMVDVPVEHGLLIENLLDLAHAPFTHTSTFARGWPVPDFVKFHAQKVLSGNWDPYPIDMTFHPPCMSVSMIGLAQPGKIMRGVTASECKNHLHQLHVCMPAKRGHTRLLYRMSLDFMPWLRVVPFIDRVWKQVAAQVLGEDLVLVLGQQDRLMRGGNTWSLPVAYDKLAVRYRRWRNAISSGDYAAGSEVLAGASMSAGQMFAIEGENEEDGLA